MQNRDWRGVAQNHPGLLQKPLDLLTLKTIWNGEFHGLGFGTGSNRSRKTRFS